MTDPTDISRGIACRCTSRKLCKEAALVLRSVGIDSEILPWEEEFLLVVQIRDAAEAARQLSQYELENRPDMVPVRPVARLSKGMYGAMVYTAILLLVDGLANSGLLKGDLLEMGSAKAGLIRGGEWWRAVTALTLHADALHLMGNVAAGVIFGLFACQSLGAGLGWLAILLTGASGNLMSALFQDHAHTSIGASTAVFAALGIQSAHTWRTRHLPLYRGLRRWSPIIGGTILLALLGGPGERIDVLSHVTGFFSGLLFGAVISPRLRWITNREYVQIIMGASAIAVIAIAWGIPLYCH